MISQKKTDTGFHYIEVTNDAATAKIALQGAHLFHYRQQGKEPFLWLSTLSSFVLGKAIRGGIPICWPWFGKHPKNSNLPQHGFARTAAFKLVAENEPNPETSELVLQLQDSAKSRELWPHRFTLRVTITVGSSVTVALSTINSDSKPFTISSALHTYFAVSHISLASIEGLAGTTYLDTLTGETKEQVGPLEIDQEVDRVYQTQGALLRLHDGKHQVQIKSTGSESTVVWNPWINKAVAMADMNDDGYKTMLCIETANAMQDKRQILPAEEHCLKVEMVEKQDSP
jgi:glucose-6-phosphate 1-epimerase